MSPVHFSPSPRIGLWIGCLLLAWYVGHMGMQPWFLDSPELVASTATLGVSHPPGHPIYHMLGWSWLAWLPVGTQTFRVHLFGAVCAAAASVGWWWLAHALGLVRCAMTRGGAVALALGLGLTQAALFQSLRAEVYALHWLLVTLALVQVVHPDRPVTSADWGRAACWLGLGLLNHHYLVIFALPAFCLLLLQPPGDGRLRSIAWGTLLGGSALAGYLYALARAPRMPAASWAWPTSGDGLWWLVSAAAFQKSAARAPVVDPMAGLQSGLQLLADSWSLPFTLLGLAGLGLLMVRRGWTGAALVAALAFNLLTQVLLDFDRDNPDVQGYFLLAFACIGLGCMAILHALSVWFDALVAQRPIRGPGLRWIRRGVVVMAALPLLQGLVEPESPTRIRSLRGHDDTRLLVRAMMDAPPDPIFVTSFFETQFLLWHARAVADERPDLEALHRAWRSWPGWDDMLRQQVPGLVHALDAPASTRAVNVEWLREEARRREVRLEAGEHHSAAEALAGGPCGLWWCLHADAAPDDAAALASLRAAVAQVESLADRHRPWEIRRRMAWMALQQAELACMRGEDEPLCGALRAWARSLAPEDDLMRERTGAATHR